MEWRFRTFDEFTNDELYALLRLRSEVFVVEQNCVFLDMDDVDRGAMHLLGYDNAGITACLRWYDTDDGVKVGRVVTSPRIRGTGVGHAILREALARIGDRSSVVSAQAQLHDYYAAHGYVRYGDEFLEDDIPHIRMRRLPTA